MQAPTSAPDAVLPLQVCERLCDALARDTDPSEALARIEAARESLLGPGLLTVNLVAERPHGASPDFVLQRGWTSNPAAYPVGGRKRKAPTPWTEHLLVRGEVFVGEGEGALAEVFDDSARIMALGLRSVVNVPLLTGTDCRATFNVLSGRAQWRREDVAAIRLLALIAKPSILQIAAG
jgi:hypothetical protein